MKSSKKQGALRSLFKVLVLMTCVCALAFMYRAYAHVRASDGQFIKDRNELLGELRRNYLQQVKFQREYWPEFYKPFVRDDHNLVHDMKMAEFEQAFKQSTWSERTLLFDNIVWEKLQLKPAFMNALNNYQLMHITEYYDYLEKTAVSYDEVSRVSNALISNTRGTGVLTKEYERMGSSITSAFTLDIGRGNILMYTEGLYRSAFNVPLPPEMEEGHDDFYASRDEQVARAKNSIN